MKTLIKNIICLLLYHFRILNLIIIFFLRRKGNLPVVILIYHRITENLKNAINNELSMNHPLSNFKREMKFIKKWFNVVTLDRAVELIKNREKSERPTLAITFDDGFEDNYALAFPILKKLNIPATIFLTTGYIETNDLPWVEKIGQTILNTAQDSISLNSVFAGIIFTLKTLKQKRMAFGKITEKMKELSNIDRESLVNEIVNKLGIASGSKLKMLNWQQIREMSNYGISFQPHTMIHPILSKMPLDKAKEEIRLSKEIVEKKVSCEVNHFAFPNGRKEDFSEELKQYCREIGFSSVSTAVYGNNAIGADIYALRRQSPGKNMPIFAVDLIRGFLRNE